MAIAFLHFTANLLIALILLRILETWLVRAYGPDNTLAKTLAFTH